MAIFFSLFFLQRFIYFGIFRGCNGILTGHQLCAISLVSGFIHLYWKAGPQITQKDKGILAYCVKEVNSAYGTSVKVTFHFNQSIMAVTWDRMPLLHGSIHREYTHYTGSVHSRTRSP